VKRRDPSCISASELKRFQSVFIHGKKIIQFDFEFEIATEQTMELE